MTNEKHNARDFLSSHLPKIDAQPGVPAPRFSAGSPPPPVKTEEVEPEKVAIYTMDSIFIITCMAGIGRAMIM